MANTIDILVIDPKKIPEVRTIEHSDETIEDIVGGELATEKSGYPNIVVVVKKGAAVLEDTEGGTLEYDETVVVVGKRGKGFRSLTSYEIKKIMGDIGTSYKDYRSKN